MSRRILHYRSEVYIRVHDALDCFSLEVSEVEEWVEIGLLLQPEMVEGEPAWPLVHLDRLAGLVRDVRLLGLDATALLWTRGPAGG